MTTMDDSGAQQEALLYDFFRQGLWKRRFGSIDDTIDSNFKLLRSILPTVDGFTVSKFAQLLNDGGRGKYAHLVEQLDQKGDTQEYEKLIATVEADMGNGTPQVKFWQLNNLLATMLKTRGLAWTTSTASTSLDIDFEARQFLNLYTFLSSLNNFAWNALWNKVNDLLPDYKQGDSLPPVHLIRECFRQVVTDVELVQRALIQRRWEVDALGRYMMSFQARALLVTDKLAWKALAAIQHLLPGTPFINPVTYFSPDTHIRRVPYSNHVILVGIRYDCITLEITRRSYGYADGTVELETNEPLPAFELMAIPHEVGHYAYRHATWDGTKRFSDLNAPSLDQAYSGWHEELFADLYGCVVAGPLAVLGLQAFLACTDREGLEEEDGEHPSSLMRPFILSEMLRLLGKKDPKRYSFSQAADALDRSWTMILQQRGYAVSRGATEQGELTLSLPDKAVSVDQVVKAVGPLLTAFADELLKHVAVDAWGTEAGSGNGDKTLSAAIPWSNKDHKALSDYNADMSNLTDYEFARRKVPAQKLIETEFTLYQTLQQFLENWGDKGPHTIGGH